MPSRFHEQHPTVEQLIRALDGELDRKFRAEIEQHLELCWGCRHKHGQLRRTMDAFAEMAEQECEAEAATVPQRWSGFTARLAAAAKEPRPTWRSANWFATSAAAGAIVAVVTVLLWPASIVSAKEAIHRSTAAEQAIERSTSQSLVLQRIRIDTPSSRVAGSVWRAASHRPRWQPDTTGDTDLWHELESVYERHALDFSRPVSAANNAAWLHANPACHEEVDKDGAYIRIRMRVQGDAGTGAIVEAELVVRENDWRPVEQLWTVRTATELRRYRVVETSRDIEPLTPQLAKWMDGIEPAPATRIAPAPLAALPVPAHADETSLPAAAERWQLDEAEVNALVAVHDSGASYLDGAQVERHKDQIQITIYPEDRSRISVLEQAVGGSQPIRIVAAQAVADNFRRTTTIAAAAPQAPLLLDDLVRLVGSARVANLMVSAHHAALRRVHVEVDALTDLERRFPEPVRSGLSPQAAMKLDRLAGAHLQESRAAWQIVASTSGPLLAVAGVAAPAIETAYPVCAWSGTAFQLAGFVRRLEELYAGGFTALAGGSDDLRSIGRTELRAELSGLQANVGAALTGDCSLPQK